MVPLGADSNRPAAVHQQIVHRVSEHQVDAGSLGGERADDWIQRFTPNVIAISPLWSGRRPDPPPLRPALAIIPKAPGRFYPRGKSDPLYQRRRACLNEMPTNLLVGPPIALLLDESNSSAPLCQQDRSGGSSNAGSDNHHIVFLWDAHRWISQGS